MLICFKVFAVGQKLIYTLFYKQHFYKQRQLKLAKNQANAKQHPEAKLLLFENYFHSSSTSSPKKNMGHTLKNKQKNSLYSWDYPINHNENEDKNEK